MKRWSSAITKVRRGCDVASQVVAAGAEESGGAAASPLAQIRVANVIKSGSEDFMAREGARRLRDATPSNNAELDEPRPTSLPRRAEPKPDANSRRQFFNRLISFKPESKAPKPLSLPILPSGGSDLTPSGSFRASTPEDPVPEDDDEKKPEGEHKAHEPSTPTFEHGPASQFPARKETTGTTGTTTGTAR